jgi:tetratricopeptide (TPR) repeat protein
MTTCLTDFRMVPTSKYMPTFEEYEKAHPEESAIHLALALAYHSQRKYDEAESEALIALKMGMKVDEGGMHQYHEAAAELACIRADRGELEQAVLMFRKYVAAMPNCLDARIEMIQMLLALDHEKFPQAVAEAQMNLDRATLIDAADPQLRQLRPLVEKARAKLVVDAADGNAAPSISGVVP